MTASPPTPARAAFWAEIAIGTLVIGMLAGAAGWGWRFYDSQLRPLAMVVPTWTSTPERDPREVYEEAKRLRQVSDYIASGNFERSRNRADLAIQAYQAALKLDPDNFEARQNLRELGVPLPPSAKEATPTPLPPTPQPTVTPRP